MTKILAIETSCDETAAAVVEDGRRVISNVINTQIAVHTRYGGVVPEIASRKHIENINPVIRAALKEAGCTLDDIDAVAVTYGPGLVGALLIGVSAAKAIAYATGKPLIGVNHIEGHVCANLIEHPDLEPPFLCLIVSGGHTHLALMKDYGEFEILGRTRDDAAGEAFDKVARAIGLGYPGGPKIEKAALLGDAAAIQFPRGHIAGSPYDFTFSGLKSAVLNYINSEQMAGREVSQANVAASFQAAVVDSIVERAVMAASKLGGDSSASGGAREDRGAEPGLDKKPGGELRLVLAGGVAANSYLRESLDAACSAAGIRLYAPRPALCTDNAAMIGAAAYYHFARGERAPLSLNAVPNLKL